MEAVKLSLELEQTIGTAAEAVIDGRGPDEVIVMSVVNFRAFARSVASNVATGFAHRVAEDGCASEGLTETRRLLELRETQLAECTVAMREVATVLSLFKKDMGEWPQANDVVAAADKLMKTVRAQQR